MTNQRLMIYVALVLAIVATFFAIITQMSASAMLLIVGIAGLYVVMGSLTTAQPQQQEAPVRVRTDEARLRDEIERRRR